MGRTRPACGRARFRWSEGQPFGSWALSAAHERESRVSRLAEQWLSLTKAEAGVNPKIKQSEDKDKVHFTFLGNSFWRNSTSELLTVRLRIGHCKLVIFYWKRLVGHRAWSRFSRGFGGCEGLSQNAAKWVAFLHQHGYTPGGKQPGQNDESQPNSGFDQFSTVSIAESLPEAKWRQKKWNAPMRIK